MCVIICESKNWRNQAPGWIQAMH